MKNKKGFTLVELIAVIIILAALALVTFPALLNQINNTKGKISDATKELIISAAKSYMNENLNLYPRQDGVKYCLNLDLLVSEDYLSESIISSDNNLDDKGVSITYNETYSYDIQDLSECMIGYELKYDPVSNSKCELGDTCYSWYVLDLTSSSAVLIMSDNLIANGSWNNAPSALSTDTSTWTVAVSLPTVYQIAKTVGCSVYPGCTYDKLPIWLNGKYWTSDTSSSNENNAYIVTNASKRRISSIGKTTSTGIGIRPVITITKSNLYD